MWINTKIKLENDGRTQLTASLSSNFKDDTLTNANSISNAWNFLFMSLDCCGIDTITGPGNVFNVTSWCIISGDCHDGVKYIPLSCCTGVTVTKYYATYTCYLALDDGSYNYKGCFSALKTAVDAYGDGFIALGFILLVLEVLAFIFTLMDVCGKEIKKTPLTGSNGKKQGWRYPV
ncbi:uncharacterized protein LOC125678752 isoform X2 [Ostrea edulis]|uniref:uncharacterized protein LOC125678752 isoform X2 n=1 Tax=Ostrea edulis TaxID=37623 RepID=UPI0020951217|nr:uncharacterized protein LOC125678752 isoform X2 [Ostrea edulis]